MNPNFIIFTIIPFVLMLAICIAMPVYKNNLMKTAGEKLVPLTKKSAKLSYFASVVAVVLLLLSIKVDFGRFNFIIPYCAVLGFFVTTKESTFLPVNGAYTNLLINGSTIIKYSDIAEVKSEESSAISNVISVVNKKGAKQQLIFNNSNEAAEVLKVLKSIDKAI